tara:strand:- start:3494 stop:6493 length:3000 start_codon:yes stop_codon:yes gene_type:complete
MDEFIKNNTIKQIYISESLTNSTAFDLYKSLLTNYCCCNTSTIFFGVYTLNDILKIKNHKGPKFVYWSGNDANIANKNRIKVINTLKYLNINKHLCSTKLIQSNLNILKLNSTIININQSKYIDKYFDITKINQIYISSSLIHLKDQIFNKYELKPYENLNDDCIFFGLYNSDDIDKLNKHKGKKYLMWGGNDALFESKAFYYNYVNKNNLYHIAISDDLFDRLRKFDIDPYIFKLNLVNKELFKPVNKLGDKIFIYNGVKKGNEETYGKLIYENIVKMLPEFDFIYSNELNLPNSEMPNIYSQCFIGLRLTKNDGNANIVQELEAMNIPVIHNLSNYGLKWNSEDDIINHILSYSKFNEFDISNNNLKYFYKTIDSFTNLIKDYKNILFICGDEPGYGGAATNCNMLQDYYSKDHNTYTIYFNFDNKLNFAYSNDRYTTIDINKINNAFNKLNFDPDLIVLKSFINYDLKKNFKCPVFYCIGGIFTNNLDKPYTELKTKSEYDEYINLSVLKQISISDKSFSNSKRTKDILKNIYNLDTTLFYSGFIPYYGQKIIEDSNFENRKYDYGLIISDFDRKIKNAEETIKILKEKKNVLLVGKNSSKYNKYGFECIENVNHNKMTKLYKDIKFIQQNSFYDSYSNVMIEGAFNGTKIKKTVVVSSTQYPGYGGAATNAYAIIKFLRKEGYNTVGVFFHSKLDVNYDPDEIGGIFLYDYKFEEDKVLDDAVKYFGVKPDICLAKNYMAPIYCKRVFNCYTVYLVSGINHLPLFYKDKTATDILNDNFLIKDINFAEVKCNEDCDLIVLNSMLSLNLFNKIYPTFNDKIYQYPIDTTNLLNIDYNTNCDNKEYDILICCSNLERVDKNNMFLINVLKSENFNKYSKIIIGENNNKYKDIPNSICTGLLDQKKCIEYMNKCKLLLFPSLADANSNTVRESYYNKCLPLITENIGFYELFPDFLICKTYEMGEWSSKIHYVLENYDNLKDTKINYLQKCKKLLSII